MMTMMIWVVAQLLVAAAQRPHLSRHQVRQQVSR